jgi:hypothetical protein
MRACRSILRGKIYTEDDSVEKMFAKKRIEFTIAGEPAEYAGVDEETGRQKYRAKGVDIYIDKNAIIVKGSREVERDIIEWRLETGDGKSFALRADKLGNILGNEKRNKALMIAQLKKQGGQVLIQGMTREDVKHFTKHKIEVNREGWMTAEQAVKAAEVASGNELELCECNFTKQRLKNIGTFGAEVGRASEFAEGMEKLIRQVRGERDKAEEVLRRKNLK